MTATITSKGQITIPLSIRQHLGLKAGDKLEFAETSPVLVARRAVDPEEWRRTIGAWQQASAATLKDHAWADAGSLAIVDDLRGGPTEPTPFRTVGKPPATGLQRRAACDQPHHLR
jgi:AbrB family looped-hinge helix DNA binding protein